MNFDVLVAVIILTAFTSLSEGLRCWTCYNSVNTKDCMRRGWLKTCRYNEKMCFTEIRNIDGRWEVTKRCKQPFACQNNKIQNPRSASIKAQCNPYIKSSVCRCCCGTDECNKKGLFCAEDTPTCVTVPKPRLGYTRCKFKKSALEVGSECRFTCLKGFTLIGATSSTCTAVPGGKPRFSTATPKCQRSMMAYTPIQCSPPMEVIENGIGSCSTGRSSGSVCKYSCNPGFELSGSPQIGCGINGRWTDMPPQCNRIMLCDKQENPKNGEVSCEFDGVSLGTVCSFSCNHGFFMDGSDSNFCTVKAGVIDWDKKPPVCEPMVCLPKHVAPFNGYVDCKTHTIGTTCSFRCNYGFTMIGLEHSICVEDVGQFGKWSSPAPLCRPEFITRHPVTVQCPTLKTIDHGEVLCSIGNSPGSDCLAVCEPGYELLGADTVWCKDDGTWSNDLPICLPMSCPLQAPIANGEIHCEGSGLMSSCYFSCVEEDHGGHHGDEDEDDHGDEDDHDDEGEVEDDHDDEDDHGDEDDDDDHEEEEDDHEEEEDDHEEEDDDHEEEEDDHEEEEDDHEEEEDDHDEEEDDHEEEEDDHDDEDDHDEIDTTDHEEDDDHDGLDERDEEEAHMQLIPKNVTRNTCVPKPDGTVGWFPPKPCCGHPCPPFLLMDLVVVLDSSSSVSDRNWKLVRRFTENVIKQFKLGDHSARMSIFRYNSKVDEDTEIKLRDTAGMNMHQLLHVFKNIPYHGNGTRTGDALIHVRDKSLSAEYGNRPRVKDIVLVITDGRAENPKKVKDVSRELRQRGVIIYGVGIGVNDLVFKRLVRMTGSLERTLHVANFEDLLNGGFKQNFAGGLCHDPCSY